MNKSVRSVLRVRRRARIRHVIVMRERKSREVNEVITTVESKKVVVLTR